MSPEQSIEKKSGRPLAVSAQKANAILEAIGRGLPIIHACRIGGVSAFAFRTWRKRNEAKIETAIANGIQSRLAVIESAARAGDWRASAWLLERTCPEFFSKTRLSIEGTVQHAHTVAISRSTLDDIAKARLRHEPKAIQITA